jgi:hypothetical protein
MSTWKINLKEQTATSISGITFKLTETKLTDDLDDVILRRMIKEAGVWYRRELGSMGD